MGSDRSIAGGEVRALGARGQIFEGRTCSFPRWYWKVRTPARPVAQRIADSLKSLKHSFNLNDEEVVVRWSQNVLWQFFSGMDYYEHRLPCDRMQIGRFRRDLGEEDMVQLIKATIDTAVALKAVKPKELERVIGDTTVQEKAIAHPVDSRLLEIARHKVVSAAKRAGSSRPLPKRARSCVVGPVDMRMPSSSGARAN